MYGTDLWDFDFLSPTLTTPLNPIPREEGNWIKNTKSDIQFQIHKSHDDD